MDGILSLLLGALVSLGVIGLLVLGALHALNMAVLGVKEELRRISHVGKCVDAQEERV